jgi:hypothetical protein
LDFTDWVVHRPLSHADRALLWQGMAVAGLYDLQSYAGLVQDAGFIVNSVVSR